MAERSPHASEIGRLCKLGDIDGAISYFKSLSEADRASRETRFAIAWCLYDRDIKPCTNPEINATDQMRETALESLQKIKTWCNASPFDPYSAYPTSFLAVGRTLRDGEQFDKLKSLLLRLAARVCSPARTAECNGAIDVEEHWNSLKNHGAPGRDGAH